MYISGMASQHECVCNYMDKYIYDNSQNVYIHILYNLIIFYKCLSKILKFITIINKFWFIDFSHELATPGLSCHYT